MSDTCIVCLGDLGENASAQPLPEDQIVHDAHVKPEPPVSSEAQQRVEPSPTFPPLSSTSDSELIAHLLPCGHNLHDECLKPWVERANSCPICRQTFNQVELMRKLNGPVVSSYPVQDRIQVAEIDPSMLIDEEEEPEYQPCRVCGNDDHEDVLLLCDGCRVPHHTYCVELSEVPSGPWFCEDCALTRAIEASMADEAAMPPAGPVAAPSRNRRTRAQLRRTRNSVLARASDWARIWEQVYDRAHFDLDFPYEDEERVTLRRTPRTRRTQDDIWQRRLQVAERQGGADQFRHIVPDLDIPTVSRPRPRPEEPETMEEVMAWNALEKARDIQEHPSPRGRKRKSATNSPTAPEASSRKRRRTRSISASPKSPKSPQPRAEPSQRKRPRARRVNEFVEPPSDAGDVSTRRNASISVSGTNGTGPSFLQSLLKEVENSAPADDPPRGRPALSIHANFDHGSPHASSPEASPTSSNLPSPRGSASPPPVNRIRPGSPSLTSRIEPIYPRLGPPELSPISPDASVASRIKVKSKSRVESENRVRQWVSNGGAASPRASSPDRAAELSPTRANMSLSAKERIQKLVREALKEHYTTARIDSDQYTDINRNVSRMLYDTIGEETDVDGDQANEWRRIAGVEVEKAVSAIRPTPVDS